MEKEQGAKASVNLDAKDYEILKLLQENAKLTIREIAHKIHLSATPVHERIKRLEQNGVIKRYTALLNHRALGESLTAICYVSLKEHTKKAGALFVQAIAGLERVIECYNISGEFDFMLKVIASNMADYHRFHVDALSEIPGVGNIQTVFVMDVIVERECLLVNSFM